MRHRQDRDELLAIATPSNKDDRTRAVFDAFFAPAPVLLQPEIGIADDKTGNRVG